MRTYGILGKKLGMMQYFTAHGTVVPVTVVRAGPCRVLQVRTRERDGYDALQLGFEEKKRANKPMQGHFRRSDSRPVRFVREVGLVPGRDVRAGEVLTVEMFKEGERVDVTGKSKGRGFAGVVKRWKFGGGPATHGAMFHRAPGSIGQSADPSRVFKGTRMPGRMGTARVTMQNLEVVKVDAERNLLMLKGAVPGPANGYLVIRKKIKGNGG